MDAVIKETQDLLLKNPEWIERYKNYVEDIKSNKALIKDNRKLFNEFSPLYFYISTTNARNAKKTLSLDVRYRGQSVATLQASSDGINISTEGGKREENNKRDFECTIKLPKIPWTHPTTSDFRKFFKERPNSRNSTSDNKKNEEHNVESLLLAEFSKQSSTNKQIAGIKPVKIENIRFGMPTPLGACDHKKLKYCNSSGGGIDILARTGLGGTRFISVIEVKDENLKNEPPQDALKQAIQYAVFIRELLRSDSGQDWYCLFGFKSSIPKKLTIRAICAMPDNRIDDSFSRKIYNIGNDIIECHYIYFNYNGKQLSNFKTSL
jgi:hypothetical protein